MKGQGHWNSSHLRGEQGRVVSILAMCPTSDGRDWEGPEELPTLVLPTASCPWKGLSQKLRL